MERKLRSSLPTTNKQKKSAEWKNKGPSKGQAKYYFDRQEAQELTN